MLDIRIRDNKVFLVIYSESNRTISEKLFDTYFYGYIASSEPSIVASELSGISDIDEVFIEKWRTPPYYDGLINVVVFKTKNYKLLVDLLRKSVWKNMKVVNTFPHPLVEAIYRAGLRPLTKINSVSGNRVELYSWKPVEKDPVIDYVLIYLENGYYVVETSSEKKLFWNLEHVVDYMVSSRIYIGFTDPHIYAKLLEIDSDLRSSVYIWITGECFKPNEYFEWSRLSYIPLSLMNNITIGRILSTIEALYARDRKYLIYKTHGRSERWRTLRELLVNDRGGVVYQPKPGLYWSVCQIDFKSLYPSIIVKYNVSGETVDKTKCSNTLALPWTSHSVCLDERGIVPESIEKLIVLKDTYDKLYRETGEEIYNYRKSAVKWILVASFGYLGYRNSFFGSVMAHEVVTSTSREVMRRARIVAEKLGYRVVHAIVDSLFIEGVRSVEECNVVKERIVKETGFEAKLEAHYIWLYIPRSLGGSYGVANKYYGLLSDTRVKVKGIMCTRRDTPLFIKKVQLEALNKLFEAKSRLDFLNKLLDADNTIDQYVEKLIRGDVDPRLLVICRDARVRHDYVKPLGYVYDSGPPYRLVYVDNKLVPYDKCCREINVNKYIELLEKARRELPSVDEVLSAIK